MIFGLIAALIVLRFVRSPQVLAAILAFLFITMATLLFRQNSETNYTIGLGLAFLFALFVSFFISRVAGTFDRLRTRKG